MRCSTFHCGLTWIDPWKKIADSGNLGLEFSHVDEALADPPSGFLHGIFPWDFPIINLIKMRNNMMT
jgi:hypothetical protein